MLAVVVLLVSRKVPEPPHPFTTIAASDVMSVEVGGAPIPRGTPAFAEAAALPKRLATVEPSQDVLWRDVQSVRLGLRDGSTLWLQAMPEASETWVRVTADGPASALRAFRLKAYHVPTTWTANLVRRDAVGADGEKPGSTSPTDLSTRTKVGRSN